MNKQEVNKIIDIGRNFLVDKWMSKEDFEDLFNNNKIKNCIDICTSPAKKSIFNAFSLFPIEETKVLIIGQDPYPESSKAEGLAFSVNDNYTEIDDSLLNIYKAVGVKNHLKSLITWARTNKVLLLNTALTYGDKTKPYKLTRKENKEIQKIHLNAWKSFIAKIIENILICNNKKLVVFLWGEKAKSSFHNAIYDDKDNPKVDIIDKIRKDLLVLSSSHPSNNGNAVKKGFYYEVPNHFKACNDFLGEDAIKWEDM